MMPRFVALLSLLLLVGCLKQELQTGLSEAEAQEIIVLLQEHGFEVTRAPSASDNQSAPTWTVYVKGGNQNSLSAWRILQENGLPRERATGLEQVFADSGLIPTAAEEKARLMVGLSGEIQKTLESVNGVIAARVHIVLPENSPLVDKTDWKPTTSSVLIKYQGEGLPLETEEIQRLVANGIEGLQTQNVAVIFKKVSVKSEKTAGFGWYLRSQELTVVSLVLAVITGFGSLALLFKSRQQRTKLELLQKRLTAGADQHHLRP
jgi:type III secretion protein J